MRRWTPKFNTMFEQKYVEIQYFFDCYPRIKEAYQRNPSLSQNEIPLSFFLAALDRNFLSNDQPNPAYDAFFSSLLSNQYTIQAMDWLGRIISHCPDFEKSHFEHIVSIAVQNENCQNVFHRVAYLLHIAHLFELTEKRTFQAVFDAVIDLHTDLFPLILYIEREFGGLNLIPLEHRQTLLNLIITHSAEIIFPLLQLFEKRDRLGVLSESYIRTIFNDIYFISHNFVDQVERQNVLHFLREENNNIESFIISEHSDVSINQLFILNKEKIYFLCDAGIPLDFLYQQFLILHPDVRIELLEAICLPNLTILGNIITGIVQYEDYVSNLVQLLVVPQIMIELSHLSIRLLPYHISNNEETLDMLMRNVRQLFSEAAALPSNDHTIGDLLRALHDCADSYVSEYSFIHDESARKFFLDHHYVIKLLSAESLSVLFLFDVNISIFLIKLLSRIHYHSIDQDTPSVLSKFIFEITHVIKRFVTVSHQYNMNYFTDAYAQNVITDLDDEMFRRVDQNLDVYGDAMIHFLKKILICDCAAITLLHNSHVHIYGLFKCPSPVLQQFVGLDSMRYSASK